MLKKYNSPELKTVSLSIGDVMTASYGEKFGVILDWDNDGGNGEA